MSRSSKKINEALVPLVKIGVSTEDSNVENMAEAFHSVLDHTQESIIIINKEGNIFYINRAAQTNIKNFKIQGDFFSYYPTEDVEILKERISNVAKTCLSENCYLEEINDGELNVFSYTINPLIKEDSVYAFSIIFRDISAEVKSKFSSKEYQERLKLALSGGEVGIWELNLKSQSVICDSILLEICNLKNFDGTLSSFNQGIHEEDISILTDAISEAVLTRGAFEIEYRLLVNEETVFILNKANVLVDEKNNPVKIIGVCQDITHLRKEDLGAMNIIISAQEKERVKIGKEIHDGIGQLLSAARMNLNALTMDLGNSESEFTNQIDKVKELISEAAEEARSISHALVPGRVNELGLYKGVLNLCESYNLKDISIVFESNLDHDKRFDEIIELNYYRISQELISNSVKHAKSSEIYILLNMIEERLELEVRDDGIGLGTKYSENKTGIGLDNVVSRVNYLNGNITIDSVPNKGTSIKVVCVPELIEKAL